MLACIPSGLVAFIKTTESKPKRRFFAQNLPKPIVSETLETVTTVKMAIIFLQSQSLNKDHVF